MLDPQIRRRQNPNITNFSALGRIDWYIYIEDCLNLYTDGSTCKGTSEHPSLDMMPSSVPWQIIFNKNK